LQQYARFRSLEVGDRAFLVNMRVARELAQFSHVELMQVTETLE
jgi:hypothetical protein